MPLDKREKILLSDTLKEVISDTPVKIVRIGSGILLAVFGIILIFACVVPYPDVIVSPVEITTERPPVTLLAKRTGKINRLHVKDGAKVKEGQLLAVMETAATIEDIDSLAGLLERSYVTVLSDTSGFPVFSGLGELQEPYARFLKTEADYSSFLRNDLYSAMIKSLEKEIQSIGEYLKRTREKEKLLVEAVSLQKNKFLRDSVLYSSKVFTDQDLENSKQALIKLKLDLQQARIDYSSSLINLSEKEKTMREYIVTRSEERDKLLSLRNESFVNLKAGMKMWMNQYQLISPVGGIVTFTGYWSENQSVNLNDPVLTIVPEDPGDFIGRIRLKMYRSGKVKEGMAVHLKLHGYPYLEYGMVRGIVKSKSLVPADNCYIIEISLPDGLRTLYGTELEFNQNMQGSAEIITNRLTLMQRLTDPFRYAASKIRE